MYYILPQEIKQARSIGIFRGKLGNWLEIEENEILRNSCNTHTVCMY